MLRTSLAVRFTRLCRLPLAAGLVGGLAATVGACGGDDDSDGTDLGGIDAAGSPDAPAADGGPPGPDAAAPACDDLPAGPLTFTTFATGFSGSEDLAFDGKGRVALRKGSAVVLVDAAKSETPLVASLPTSYGMRFVASGALVVALPQEDKLVSISSGGQVSDFGSTFNGPNGLFADLDGNIYVTEFAGNVVARVATSGMTTPLVMAPTAKSPNGVVRDAATQQLFFSNYTAGDVLVLDLDGAGATAALFADIGGRIDGLTIDECGHVYAVDQQNDRVYRIRRDASGAKAGDPELLAEFPTNVANAQFGRGTGFNANSLYVAGTPGTIYELPVGVAGAPIPLVP